MAQMTSGKVLHEARERKGYDLNTVARRLRIRPDILRAIEAGDFNAMPPRGYTRNMVNAYARLLGLNPTEIVNMYLDEAYANQVQRARGSAPSSGFDMERGTRRTRNRTRVNADTTSSNRSYEADRSSTIRSGVTQATRILYDDGTRFARDDYGVTRERTERPGKSDRDFLSHHSGYDTSSFDFLDDGSGKRSSRSIHVQETPNSLSASRVPAFLRTRAAIVVIAVLVLALIGGVAFAVFGNNGSNNQEDVGQLPVSGVADTTGDESGSSASAAVEIAPTSSRVIYSVPSGQECYVETYLDGKMTPEMLTGPVERSVEVTGVWTITTYTPETLKLTVDGVETQLKVDENYNDMYAYTVDFPAILKKWNSEHGTSSSSASSSKSSSSTSSSGSAATTQSSRESYEESVNYDDSVNLEENQAVDESASEEDEDTEEGEEGENYEGEDGEYYDESEEEDEEGYYEEDGSEDEYYDGSDEYEEEQ